MALSELEQSLIDQGLAQPSTFDAKPANGGLEGSLISQGLTVKPSKPEATGNDALSGLIDLPTDTDIIADQWVDILQDREDTALGDHDKEVSDRKDVAKLEEDKKKAILSGNKEDLIKANQGLNSNLLLNKALGDQEDALVEAKRALFRQAKEAEALGTAFDRSQTRLDRDSSMISRQVGLASRGADQAVAQAANISAQSGFGSSSALQGFSASAKSQAATNTGNVATNFVGLDDKFADLQAGRDKLTLDIADNAFNSENLQAKFDTNEDFLLNTFDLGGDIAAASNSINLANQAQADKVAQQSAGLGTAIAGVSVGLAGAPIIGGAIIVKGLFDYFD